MQKKLVEMDDVEIRNMLKTIDDLDKDFFLHYSKEIHRNKPALLEKFPCSVTSRHVVPDITSESNSCAFCLGIGTCKKIYPESEVSESLHLHQPLISIVIYLSPFDIHVLLTYMLKWYQTIGLTQHLAKWMFVLLICLKEQATLDTVEFLVSLSQKLNKDKKSKAGAELVRLSYLLKCINSIFNLEKFKNIEKLLQYENLSIKTLSL